METSRTEEILKATINGEPYDEPPQSRIENLLLELKEVIEQGGGGGGSSYTKAETDALLALKADLDDLTTQNSNGDIYIGSTLVIKYLTQAEYDALDPPSPNVQYNIIEAPAQQSLQSAAPLLQQPVGNFDLSTLTEDPTYESGDDT